MSPFWSTLIGAIVGGLFLLTGAAVAEKFRRQREDAEKIRVLRAEARVALRICEETDSRPMPQGKAIWLALQISSLPARWEFAVALRDEVTFGHLIDFQTALRLALYAANKLEETNDLMRQIRSKIGKDKALLEEAEANLQSITRRLETAIDDLKLKAGQLVADLDRLIVSESPTADS